MLLCKMKYLNIHKVNLCFYVLKLFKLGLKNKNHENRNHFMYSWLCCYNTYKVLETLQENKLIRENAFFIDNR